MTVPTTILLYRRRRGLNHEDAFEELIAFGSAGLEGGLVASREDPDGNSMARVLNHEELGDFVPVGGIELDTEKAAVLASLVSVQRQADEIVKDLSRQYLPLVRTTVCESA